MLLSMALDGIAMWEFERRKNCESPRLTFGSREDVGLACDGVDGVDVVGPLVAGASVFWTAGDPGGGVGAVCRRRGGFGTTECTGWKTD